MQHLRATILALSSLEMKRAELKRRQLVICPKVNISARASVAAVGLAQALSRARERRATMAAITSLYRNARTVAEPSILQQVYQ